MPNMQTPSHSPTSDQCLQTMVFLLEELENKSSSIESTALDSGLASHKEALNHCNAMLRCAQCTTRSENMMLLAFVCEKLVTLCEKVVGKYKGQPHPGHDFLRRQGDGMTSKGGSSGCSAAVVFGDYGVDLPLEWDCVIRVLIILQLKSLGNLLARMKMMASSTVRGAQLSVLLAAERRVGNVVALFQQSGASEFVKKQ